MANLLSETWFWLILIGVIFFIFYVASRNGLFLLIGVVLVIIGLVMMARKGP